MFTFRKLLVKDPEVSRVQDNIADAFRRVATCPLVDGALVTASVVSGQNTIPHLLSRLPLGWVVVDRRANVTLYRVSWDNNNLVLQASGSDTITLWVF